MDLSQYEVVGKEEEWEQALGGSDDQPGIVSIARQAVQYLPLYWLGLEP